MATTVLDRPVRSERTVPFAARVAVLAAPVVLVLVLGWARRWVADDAFINFRIVKELRAGNGLVFNPGERVEAGTSLLWLLVLAFFKTVTPFRVEWIAVVVGLVCTAGAFVLGEVASIRMLRDRDDDTAFFVPFGALVVAAVPAMWDFATSGLETGLSFAWLAGSFYALTLAARDARRRVWWIGMLVGSGPIVRPDFALFSAVFLGALLVTRWRTSRLARLKIVALALAIPVASEIFRLAYYANVVPNTALAKEANRVNWYQGWQYLHNFAVPYALWIPFVVVGVVAGPVIAEGWERGAAWAAVMIAPIAGAIVHALYVIRLGGDFMHARFFLPALFALTLPIFVLRITRRDPFYVFATGVICVWAVVCAGWLRPPRSDIFILDERHVWTTMSHSSNPVTIDAYRYTYPYGIGHVAHTVEQSGQRLVVLHGGFPGFTELTLADDVKYPVVVEGGPLGITAFAAPTNAYVIDGLGLADVVGARLDVKERGRPGHEKALPPAWMVARFAQPGYTIDSAPMDQVDAARHALQCGKLPELFRRTSGPLGLSELLGNIGAARDLTSFSLPPVPIDAEHDLC